MKLCKICINYMTSVMKYFMMGDIKFMTLTKSTFLINAGEVRPNMEDVRPNADDASVVEYRRCAAEGQSVIIECTTQWTVAPRNSITLAMPTHNDRRLTECEPQEYASAAIQLPKCRSAFGVIIAAQYRR